MENLYNRSTKISAVKLSGLLFLGFILYFGQIRDSSAVTILHYCVPATNVNFTAKGNAIKLSADNIVRFVSGGPSIYYRHIVAYRLASQNGPWSYKTVGMITRLNDRNSWWQDYYVRDLVPNRNYELELLNRCSSGRIPNGGGDIGGSTQSVIGKFYVTTGDPAPCNETPAGIQLQHTKPAGGKSIVYWGDGSAAGWQLAYRKVGRPASAFIGGIHNLTWKAFTISGLQPDTKYEVFIRPTCGPWRPGKWGATHIVDTTQ